MPLRGAGMACPATASGSAQKVSPMGLMSTEQSPATSSASLRSGGPALVPAFQVVQELSAGMGKTLASASQAVPSLSRNLRMALPAAEEGGREERGGQRGFMS